MQITYGQPVLLDGQLVGTLRTNRDGGIAVLVIEDLHEVTLLGTVSNESHATGLLRKHVAGRSATEEVWRSAASG